MAAFCGFGNNFIACSDNGLAQQRAFFSVSFRDIQYISALSACFTRFYSIFIPFILEFER